MVSVFGTRESDSEEVKIASRPSIVPKQMNAIADEQFAPLVFRALIAATADDRSACEDCVNQIDRLADESEEYFILSRNAQMVIASALNDRDLFVKQFTVLCWRKYSAGEIEALAKDCLNVAIVDLCPLHPGWGVECIARGLNGAIEIPDSITLFLHEYAKRFLTTGEYEQIVTEFTEESLTRARRVSDPPTSDSWHKIAESALQVYRANLESVKLWRFAKSYFDLFGATGPQSPLALGLALDASNEERRTGKPEPDWQVVPNREWLDAADKRLQSLDYQSKSLHLYHSAWKEFRENELSMLMGKVELIHLQRDMRLQKVVRAQFDGPRVTVRDLCERLSKDVGIPIRVSEGTDVRLIASGPTNIDGPAVSAFQLVLNSAFLKGAWHRTRDGYEYHSDIDFDTQTRLIQEIERRENPLLENLKAKKISGWLHLANAVLLVSLLIWALTRSRKSSVAVTDASSEPLNRQ